MKLFSSSHFLNSLSKSFRVRNKNAGKEICIDHLQRDMVRFSNHLPDIITSGGKRKK